MSDQNRSDKFLRWASFIVDAFLLIAIGSYTIVAWEQWKEMKLDRRAWVAVNAVKGMPEAGKPFIVTVVITNTGKTFAKNIDVVATESTVRNGELPDFANGIREAAKMRDPKLISHFLLAPGAFTEQTLESRETKSLSDNYITNLKNGNPRFFVYGQVTYTDIFNHPHWLTFCTYLNFNPSQPEGLQWSYVNYQKYNDTGPGQPPWRY